MSSSASDPLSRFNYNDPPDPENETQPTHTSGASDLDSAHEILHTPKLREAGEDQETARLLPPSEGPFGPLGGSSQRQPPSTDPYWEDDMAASGATATRERLAKVSSLDGWVRKVKADGMANGGRSKAGAVILLRVSSLRQLNTGADVDPEGNSIATQREVVRRKVRAMKLTVLEEFVEPGQSAQTIAKRPIFKQMLQYVRDNADEIGAVIIYSRSRAFRNIYDANSVEQEFQDLGVELISATEDFGSDPDQAALMKQITDGMNHYSVRANGRDVSAKMAHKVRHGGSIGRAKVGYLNDRKDHEGRLVTTISVDPERASLVKWAFEMYATGEYSLSALQEMLTDQGLRTRKTQRWESKPISQSSLANMLRDPYYTGVMIYKGVLYPGNHEPLISVELFKKVQEIMDARMQRGRRDILHNHWAKGLVWCKRCADSGTPMRLIFNEAKGRGGTYHYFLCRGRQEKTCDLPYLADAKVEKAVERLLGRVALNSAEVAALRAGVEDAVVRSQELERDMSKALRAELR